MLSLYEILKASKTGVAPDMWTALAGMNWGGADSGHEVKELTGIPPLSFRADGTPLLDFLISGNMSQTGTPTPDTPIQPQGCGERTGNLFDENYPNIKEDIPTYRSIYVGDGTFTLSTTTAQYRNTSNVFFLAGNVARGANTQNNGIWNGNPRTVTALDGYVTIAYRYYIDDEESDPRSNDVMLNTGSEALPYEPFGVKIPISSGGTTTPVYLGEVQTTRMVKKWVLTGKETSWNKGNYPPAGGYQFFIPKPSDIADNPDWLTTHFKKGSGLNGSAFASFLSLYPEASILPENATINDFKAWLAGQYDAGTPVCVWYVLANPETAVVNEPLRKIGDYADTLSMEQAGVSIPTNNGSTTVDVETTLKPSEMYIKYKG